MIKLSELLEDKLSFSEVYKQTYDKTFKGVCIRYAKGDYDLAQEYCQNGFIRVYQQLDKFKGESSISTWVSRVVTNSILNQLRSPKKQIQTDTDVDVNTLNIVDEPVEKEDEIEYMGKYSKQLIRNAINSLPEGYKYIFTQYYFNGKSHSEIAKELNINDGTSRSQLAKAKAKIKKYLESNT